jgi:hypothetical protein
MAVTRKSTDAAPDASNAFDNQPVQSIALDQEQTMAAVTVDDIRAAARTGQISDHRGQMVAGAITHVSPSMEVITIYEPSAHSGKGIALANGWMVDDLATGVPYRAGSNLGTYRHAVNGAIVDEATLARMLERGQP